MQKNDYFVAQQRSNLSNVLAETVWIMAVASEKIPHQARNTACSHGRERVGHKR